MRFRFTLPLLVLALACGDDDGTTDDTTDAPDVDMAVETDAGPPGPPGTIGPDDRRARVTLPNGYDEAESYPVVMLLHGYGASGLIQGAYFTIPALARDMGFIGIIPDGTTDAGGNQFWNATDACCDFGPTGVDDVAYLSDLIDEALETYAADPDRVYLIGHSNGGFMSYRMACDASDKIAGLVSLAGATWGDPMDCGEPTRPVSVLQIHGTADGTIAYSGGTVASRTIPSARGSVERFAERSGCTVEWTEGAPIDFDSTIDGAETVTESISDGCTEGTAYELWTIEEGEHIPSLADGAIRTSLEWLLAQ